MTLHVIQSYQLIYTTVLHKMVFVYEELNK